MVRMNISLDEKTRMRLRMVSKEENRPMSKQIKHMIEFYIRHRDEYTHR